MRSVLVRGLREWNISSSHLARREETRTREESVEREHKKHGFSGRYGILSVGALRGECLAPMFLIGQPYQSFLYSFFSTLLTLDLFLFFPFFFPHLSLVLISGMFQTSSQINICLRIYAILLSSAQEDNWCVIL